ncbi:SLEI family protein family [Trichomonas vaginalis G3]|uniref:SLEI family protein family n=1 Tax=Trichomonas vaginalis (strain ATCC PRA-98 / G3) TaxID=412133 RepID=UPI0021E5C547|nr:SLEI family protein family [Trichomonas vaginalis G3]KAI5510726.1 SLEI family protein family [Trichomonas vaginalis G3]
MLPLFNKVPSSLHQGASFSSSKTLPLFIQSTSSLQHKYSSLHQGASSLHQVLPHSSRCFYSIMHPSCSFLVFFNSTSSLHQILSLAQDAASSLQQGASSSFIIMLPLFNKVLPSLKVLTSLHQDAFLSLQSTSSFNNKYSSLHQVLPSLHQDASSLHQDASSLQQMLLPLFPLQDASSFNKVLLLSLHQDAFLLFIQGASSLQQILPLFIKMLLSSTSTSLFIRCFLFFTHVLLSSSSRCFPLSTKCFSLFIKGASSLHSRDASPLLLQSTSSLQQVLPLFIKCFLSHQDASSLHQDASHSFMQSTSSSFLSSQSTSSLHQSTSSLVKMHASSCFNKCFPLFIKLPLFTKSFLSLSSAFLSSSNASSLLQSTSLFTMYFLSS